MTPAKNEKTEKRIPARGIRMLTGFVREWGTIMIVMGVKINFRNILGLRIPASFWSGI